MKAIALFATIWLSGCTSLAGNFQVKMMTPSSEENQNFKTFENAEYFDIKQGNDTISVQSQGDADGRIVLVLVVYAMMHLRLQIQFTCHCQVTIL
ncbi:MAG: hypothetical protein CFH43_00082 [Proteobacteria bacterium]|nr:MAG: hypothetical protein CFH43_00082 [Pseudomonadota bacterium]